MKRVLKRQVQHMTLGTVSFTPFHSHITTISHQQQWQFIWANGTVSKPELIVSGKDLPPVPDHILSAFSWRGQAKGWVTNEIMFEAIQKTFIPEVNRRRAELDDPNAAAILFMDGHKSHQTTELKKILEKNNIILLLFVPHASHIMQPLDLVLFGKFKALLRSVFLSSPLLSYPILSLLTAYSQNTFL